ncbi:hypothetical protein [Rhizobium miluonense]|uniref:hypothetical protein n=1 Tax=Rhizobium miluonense TaxID=411945 RepID=UPI0013565705|nr:hypothetical protein [Rhizobium miluonense]
MRKRAVHHFDSIGIPTLGSEATRHGYHIRDTSRLSLDQCVAHVLEHLRKRTP